MMVGNKAYFRCPSPKCGHRRTVREGTFLFGCRCSLSRIILLLYTFTQLNWTYDQVVKETFTTDDNDLIGRATIAKYYNICRTSVNRSVMEKTKTKKIGDPGDTVEIDESCFGKRKYNRGRQVRQCWVLGGVSRNTSK